MTTFQLVAEFHRKFGLPVTPGIGCASWDRRAPALPDPDTFLFRLQFMYEELNEILAAYRAGDLAKVADGLADLDYVLAGTAHFLGVPHDDVVREVHRANMAKERAAGAADARSSRGSALDVVKPEGWAPPDVAGVLAPRLVWADGGRA